MIERKRSNDKSQCNSKMKKSLYRFFEIDEKSDEDHIGKIIEKSAGFFAVHIIKPEKNDIAGDEKIKLGKISFAQEKRNQPGLEANSSTSDDDSFLFAFIDKSFYDCADKSESGNEIKKIQQADPSLL